MKVLTFRLFNRCHDFVHAYGIEVQQLTDLNLTFKSVKSSANVEMYRMCSRASEQLTGNYLIAINWVQLIDFREVKGQLID